MSWLIPIIIFDQVTKKMAETFNSQSYKNRIFELTYVQNTGLL